MKLSPVKDRRKANDENGARRKDDIAVGIHGRQRCVEGPSGIDTAGDQHVDGEETGNHVDVPAQEIEFRKGEIPGTDHQRNEELSRSRACDICDTPG